MPFLLIFRMQTTTFIVTVYTTISEMTLIIYTDEKIQLSYKLWNRYLLDVKMNSVSTLEHSRVEITAQFYWWIRETLVRNIFTLIKFLLNKHCEQNSLIFISEMEGGGRGG